MAGYQNYLHKDPETGERRLPESLQIRDVPVSEALVALASRLEELAECMPFVGDIECQVNVDPVNGRASLYFRAYR